MTEEEILKRMIGEIASCEQPLEFAIAPLNAMQLAGLLQLALRHPGVEPNTRLAAATFIKAVRFYFRELPAISEVLRRGYRDAGVFTCPHCGMTSHNPNDVAHAYCGACHRFAEDEDAPQTQRAP